MVSLALLWQGAFAVNNYQQLPWYSSQIPVELEAAEAEAELRAACPAYQDYSTDAQWVSIHSDSSPSIRKMANCAISVHRLAMVRWNSPGKDRHASAGPLSRRQWKRLSRM